MARSLFVASSWSSPPRARGARWGHRCLPDRHVVAFLEGSAVSVEDSFSAGHNHLVFWDEDGSGCPAGSFKLLTYELSGATFVVSDNVAFTILKPPGR